MRNVLTLFALAVSAVLSLASAQTTVRAQSIVVSPVQAAPVQALHLPSALVELIRAGGTITLTDGQERTVANVNLSGTLKLTAGTTVQSATVVSVTRGATTTRYSLASPVGSGPLLVTVRNAEGRTQVISLVSAVGLSAPRQDGKKDDGKKKTGQQDEQDNQGQDNQGQNGNSGQPGNGNGHH